MTLHERIFGPSRVHSEDIFLSPFRSSDLPLIEGQPFLFVLTRLMNLRPPSLEGDALTMGTIVHHHLHALLQGQEAEKPEEVSDEDWIHGKTWTEAYLTIPLSRILPLAGGPQTLVEQISESEILFSEDLIHCRLDPLTLSFFDAGIDRLPVDPLSQYPLFTIQPDLIVRHPHRPETIHVLDFKTTGHAPSDIIKVSPYRFQNSLYWHVVKTFLQEQGVQFSNLVMTNVIVRKPTIRFGQKDRPFTIDTSPYRSGPNKGIPRNVKVYEGDPHPKMYLDRCLDWIQAENEYDHLKNERALSPVVLHGSHYPNHFIYDPWLRDVFAFRMRRFCCMWKALTNLHQDRLTPQCREVLDSLCLPGSIRYDPGPFDEIPLLSPPHCIHMAKSMGWKSRPRDPESTVRIDMPPRKK